MSKSIRQTELNKLGVENIIINPEDHAGGAFVQASNGLLHHIPYHRPERTDVKVKATQIVTDGNGNTNTNRIEVTDACLLTALTTLAERARAFHAAVTKKGA